MSWWAWLVTGIILLISEAAAPGTFFMAFFSLAALCVGGLVRLGLFPELWQQWSVFAILSIVFTIALRRHLVTLLSVERTPNSQRQFNGQKAKTSEAIEPQTTGKGEFQGVSWNMYNLEEYQLSEGLEVEIVERDGLTLKVRTCKKVVS